MARNTVSVAYDRLAGEGFIDSKVLAGTFVTGQWRRLMAREHTPSAVGNGGNSDPAGHPCLRAAIARHIGVSRGVQASAGDVIVTNGIQQALDAIAGCSSSRAPG